MFLTQAPGTLDAWVERLSGIELPVLARTATALRPLLANEDNVGARALADVILTDPLMTARVFATLATARSGRQLTDITRIEGCVLMMGVPRFVRSCADLPVVETLLRGRPEALRGFLRVARRARHAWRYAWDIAIWRQDHEVEELAIAASLHDMAEMLVWAFAPDLAIAARDHQRNDPGRRSRDAQQAVLNIHLLDLQLALIRAWHLPEMLVTMMDDAHAESPRVRNVLYAVNIARHSAAGWDNPALPDDYENLAALLTTSADRARALITGEAIEDSPA